MRDYGLDKGLIEFRDDTARNQRGWSKGFFGFRKMFRDYLTKLNVPFYDPCCPALTGLFFPVRWNEEDDVLERFDSATETWVSADLIADSISTDSIVESTTGAGVTVEGVKIEDSAITNPSDTMIAGFYPKLAQQGISAGVGGAISLIAYVTEINTDGTDDAYTLANGTFPGQMKKIRLVTDGGGNGVVTVATLAGGTTLTFNDAGDEVELIWDGTAWYVLDLNGAAMS
jgi:hypothetical protein